ncbi:MAG: PEP-CTERM sorting domain-containing protein [Planctomycetota bacterium]
MHKYGFGLVGALSVVVVGLDSGPAWAGLSFVNGVISASASSDDGREDFRALPVDFGTTTIDFVGPSDFGESTTVFHELVADVAGLSLQGDLTSMSQGSNKVTQGSLSTSVPFEVNEAADYLLRFTLDVDDGAEAALSLIENGGSPSFATLFMFNPAGQGGIYSFEEVVSLDPNDSYFLASAFDSTADGSSGPATGVTSYSFSLTLIPEPTTGALALIGCLGFAARRRVRCG